MKIYEVKIGTSTNVVADVLYVQSSSFNGVVKEANKLLDGDQYSEREIVSVSLIGTLEKKLGRN